MIKPIKKFMLLSVTLTVLCAGLGGCAQTGAKNNTENQQLGESNQENNQEDNQENKTPGMRQKAREESAIRRQDRQKAL